MKGLIEITLPSVQIWSYDEAPLWARLYDDDSDWVVFVPDRMESFFDVELLLSSLPRSHFFGNGKTVPGGKVWIATH